MSKKGGRPTDTGVYTDRQTVRHTDSQTDRQTYKMTLELFIIDGCCMYVTYIDASKAFDRVNHRTLFTKLIKGVAPRWRIRALCHWYCKQSLCVEWESVLSDFFLLTMVLDREELYMSTLLFNLYVNE